MSKDNDSTALRQCTKCQDAFPPTLEYFHKAGRGLRGDCKYCARTRHRTSYAANQPARLAYRTGYWQANREEILARSKARYWATPEKFRTQKKVSRATHIEQERARSKAKYARNREQRLRQGKVYYRANRARILQREKAYNVANREKKRAKNAAYRAANQKQLRAYYQAYRAAYPELARAKAQRRRARKVNAPVNDLTAAQWTAILVHYNYRCVYCKPTCGYCRRKTHILTKDHIEPYAKGGSNTVWNVVPACRRCNGKKGVKPPLVPVQPLLLVIS